MRPRLTYANVAATIALGLSVAGGSAVAASLLDSSDVRNNSLTGRDVKDRSLAKRDLKPSVLTALQGPAGERGAPGQQGPAGPTGPAGTDGAGAKAFRFEVSANTARTEILRFRGLILEASCTGVPDNTLLELVVRTEADGAMLGGGYVNNFGAASPVRETGLATGDEDAILNEPDGEGGGSFVFETAAGAVTSVVFGFAEETVAGPGCWLAGTATPGD